MEDLVRTRALELGFSHVGFCAADGPLEPPEFLEDWLANGRHAGMRYLARDPRTRVEPRSIFPAARSMVVVAAPYETPPDNSPIAAYARLADYHAVMTSRLEQLLDYVQSLRPAAGGAVSVDTRPLLERRAAALAGVGWFGKNTMIMNVDQGPWMMLGELILDVALQPDEPVRDRCGTCQRCLDACPTSAFVAPYVLDARRCISYWTIEHRGPTPEWMREATGTRIFGCDDCLISCPFGGREDRRADTILPVAPELRQLDPERVIELLEMGFNRNFKRFAIARAGKAGLLRNCLTALGNGTDPDKMELVSRFLDHENDGVREHAEWAIERLRNQSGS